ncbi:MAG: anti-sigma factor family protein [Alphaproteobacteria bacterium]
MTSPDRISEDDLHAYADGVLDEAARAEIEAWLAQHPDDAARIASWRQQEAGLHAAYDGVLDEPLPASMQATLDDGKQRGRRAGWMRAAAAIVLFAAGAATGWGLRGGAGGPEDMSAGFVRQAVGAHVVFTAERRHAVEARADTEERHLIRWLSKRLGQPIKPPPLSSVGFQLYGGRLVSDAGGPAAQFMYQDKAKRRVTLYVRRGGDGGRTAFRFATERGVAAFYWIDSPLSYALIGRMEREELLKLARIVYDNL